MKFGTYQIRPNLKLGMKFGTYIKLLFTWMNEQFSCCSRRLTWSTFIYCFLEEMIRLRFENLFYSPSIITINFYYKFFCMERRYVFHNFSHFSHEFQETLNEKMFSHNDNIYTYQCERLDDK